MNKNELVAIRDVKAEDRNFLLATWLRGLYYGESWFSLINKNVFMAHYHKVINYLLDSPNTTIKVACLKDDPEVILGYVVLSKSPGVMHWVFVKKAWRKIGIGKLLVPADTKIVTHLTKAGLGYISNHSIDFNPFIV